MIEREKLKSRCLKVSIVALGLTAFLLASPVRADSLYIQQINLYRESNGLGWVKEDDYTCEYATRRARDSVKNIPGLTHAGFDETYRASYPSVRYVTENLAAGFSDEDVVKAWINSPGHRANLLADTPFMCVRKALGGYYGTYYALEGYTKAIEDVKEVRNELLSWYGYHRGSNINEKASPKFHEIIDHLEQILKEMETNDQSKKSAPERGGSDDED